MTEGMNDFLNRFFLASGSFICWFAVIPLWRHKLPNRRNEKL